MVKIVDKSKGPRFKKEPVAAQKRPAICLAFLGVLTIMAGAMMIGVSDNGQNDIGLKVGGGFTVVFGLAMLVGGFVYKYIVHHRMKEKRMAIYAVPDEDPEDPEDFRANTPIEPINIPLDRRRSTIVNGVIIRVPNDRLRKIGMIGPQQSEDPDMVLDSASNTPAIQPKHSHPENSSDNNYLNKEDKILNTTQETDADDIESIPAEEAPSKKPRKHRKRTKNNPDQTTQPPPSENDAGEKRVTKDHHAAVDNEELGANATIKDERRKRKGKKHRAAKDSDKEHKDNVDSPQTGQSLSNLRHEDGQNDEGPAEDTSEV